MRRCLTLLLFLFVCSLLVAQESTGTILGTVTESTGAVLPNATVTVTNTDKNTVIRTLKTNKDGNYVAPYLPVGRYSVKIEAPGFKTNTTQNLQLNVSDRLAVNASLTAGQVSEVVNVQAPALLIDTQSSAATGLINGTQIRELALSARNYEEMVALQPGVSSAVTDTIFVGVETPGGGTNEPDFSINGSRFSQINWTIDGADNVDRGGNFSLLNYPSVDAIEEFKVLRSQYNAELGRSAGAQVNVITRSGTDKFHGTLYEFFRNDGLNANRYLNKHTDDPTQVVPRPPLRYNDFGWTLGGPLYIPGHYNTHKDKTFFFFSQEFRRIVTTTDSFAVVPTAAEVQGNFDQPVCTVPTFDPVTGACTGPTTTTISPASFNPAATAFIKDVFSKIPLAPSSVDNSVILPGKNIFNYRQELFRIDHTFSPRLMVTGRFINDTIPTINPNGLFGQSDIPGYATTQTESPGRSFLVRGTMTFTHNLLNEAGYAFSYGALESTPTGLNTFAASPDVVSAITLPFASPLQRIPNLEFGTGSGYFGFGPYRDYNRNHNWFDNLSWLHGKHIFKFGFSYSRYQKNENDAGANPSNGDFSFFNVDPNGDATYAQEWANFLLGNVSSFVQTKTDFHAKIRQRTFEAYAQDEYKIIPNLMLSFGVRYTYYGQPFDADHRNSSFDPQLYDPSKAPALDPTTGLLIAPDTSFPLNGMIISRVNSPFGDAIAETPKANFAPRVGISWDPFGKGKTAIRAGYGMYYDALPVGFVENNTFTNPPFVGSSTFSNTTFDNPASVAPDVDLSPQVVKGVKKNWKLPYTHQWSLDIQQELPFGIVGDVGYYGTAGHHLQGIIDINQPAKGAYLAAGISSTPIDDSTTPLLALVRPFQGYGPINISAPIFDSSYNSLQLSARKMFHGGSQVSVNYTWSHALTDAPNDFSTPQDNTNLAAENGPTDFDRRHIFNFNFVYEFPWKQNQQGWAGHLLGGWELSGIGTYETGQFFTASCVTSDPAGLGLLDPNTSVSFSNLGQTCPGRPDQVADPNSGAPQTVEQWFNTSAFAEPTTLGVPGNARRGTIRGPGLERLDLSLFKNIRVTEGTKFQFRVEAFNVFNHTNFESIDTNVNSSTFGQVTGVHEPRIIQLGLKFNF